ncbi:zonular occludens toxin domain-containing protein [Desulfosporosinus sp. BG]|uniref:zonular occludens toxin domain-containing protein n=1 Tax=Desulfosporosinus sp. BG TaxID=1633135 RepID=UPI00083AA29B|nr:zonular occludens toxin domain-containing protein [Desulfosporosinus sp. BG]ODA41064.1 Zonular occludens toxin [Desulfosporosinus sp. BG]
MSISFYSGTPGSGKSYNAICQILWALRLNKMVIANFPIKFTDKEIKRGYDKRFFYLPNEQITVESLVVFAIEHGMIEKKKESQCLVVIDEAGGRFNCRESLKTDRAEWIDFFSQYRKLGYYFILVAQNDRMIDKQIRGFVEYEMIHRKVNRFGPFRILPFTLFVCVEKWYVVKQKVGAEFILYRKRIANRYDTYAMFTGFKLSQTLLDKITNIRAPVPLNQQVPVTAIFDKSGMNE